VHIEGGHAIVSCRQLCIKRRAHSC